MNSAPDSVVQLKIHEADSRIRNTPAFSFSIVQHYFLFIKYGFHNIGLEEKLIKLPKSNKTAKEK